MRDETKTIVFEPNQARALGPTAEHGDEVTAVLISAAFVSAEKIMVERGLNSDEVASAFLAKGIGRLWSDGDRERLRAKAYAAASSYVDGLFDSIGEPRRPSAFPEMDTPAFAARAYAIVAKEERSFQAWLSTDGYDTLIDEAVAAGRNAFRTAPDDNSKPRSWAVIDLGIRRVKPLVLALQRRGIGALKASNLTYVIQPQVLTSDLGGDRFGPNLAAIEAFALKLSAPGFEISILHERQNTLAA